MSYSRRFLLAANYTTATAQPFPPVAKAVPAAEPPESVEVESDFVVILAALLCALICVVGLIAVARCAWLRRGAAGIGRTSGHRSANKGLKKKVLNSLPRYTYESSAAVGKVAAPSTAAECAICLTEYADGDEIRLLPQCGHGFHVQCIDTWLGSHSSCPSCRQILVVTRCRKCGEFPAVGAAESGGCGGQAEVKPGQDSSAPSTSSAAFLP